MCAEREVTPLVLKTISAGLEIEYFTASPEYAGYVSGAKEIGRKMGKFFWEK